MMARLKREKIAELKDRPDALLTVDEAVSRKMWCMKCVLALPGVLGPEFGNKVSTNSLA
jgi:hypothetical protein